MRGMELRDRICVVTGGASGIGRALCLRFAAEGARAVVVVDRDADGAVATAATMGDVATPMTADVTVEADIEAVVDRTEAEIGPIDLFASNAGILGIGGIEATDETWDLVWRVNVLAHLFAARAVVPRMLERGHGHLLNTASAAGLLTQPGDAPYSVTKHAAVALAEWLVDDVRRPGHRGVVPVPDGGGDRHARAAGRRRGRISGGRRPGRGGGRRRGAGHPAGARGGRCGRRPGCGTSGS